MREDEDRIEKAIWVKKMTSRVFTCERQVNRSEMKSHPVVEAIEHQGLHFLFNPVKKFRKQMVKTFYENMVVDEEAKRIVSTVGKVTVEVTPNSIASYLDYKRPDSTNYPGSWRMEQSEQVETLTEYPDSYNPQGTGRYKQGKLKPKYRTLNTVIHHNLSPFSLEKTPTRYDGKVLIVFGSVDAKVDWAWWIWDEMMRFRDKGSSNANVPFPVMITSMCAAAGCKPITGDGLEDPSPGPIHGGTLKKSASASKTSRTKTVPTSLPTSSSHHERNEEWHAINNANQRVLLDNQRKLEANQRRLKRGQDKMMRLLKLRNEANGETKADSEEDTDSELEGLHDFDESDTDEGEYEDDGGGEDE